MYCSIDFVRDMPFLLKKAPSCFQHLGLRVRRYLGFFDIKSFAIESTKEYSFDLSDYSQRLKNDFDVVTAAVLRNGHALKHASNDLKNNKRIVLSAVSENGNSLQHASKEIRADRKVVIAAIKQNGYALEFASYDLRNNPKVVLIAALQFPCSINKASKELLNNYDFITGCIKKNPAIKKYIQIPKPKPATETKV